MMQFPERKSNHLTDDQRAALIFSIGLHPDDTTITEILRVFHTVRVAACADTPTSVEAAVTVTAHDHVLVVMVSPSEDTNLDFPWFMVVDPDTNRYYYVQCESYKSQ